MPRGDRTGPFGAGPLTGRGMGFCAGYPVPGYMNPGFGRVFGGGFGRGFGRGYGFRYQYYATGLPGWARAQGYQPYPYYPSAPYPTGYSAKDELELLRNQSKDLKTTLDEISKRINELESDAEDEK